jgi:hypothetical protein
MQVAMDADQTHHEASSALDDWTSSLDSLSFPPSNVTRKARPAAAATDISADSFPTGAADSRAAFSTSEVTYEEVPDSPKGENMSDPEFRTEHAAEGSMAAAVEDHPGEIVERSSPGNHPSSTTQMCTQEQEEHIATSNREFESLSSVENSIPVESSPPVDSCSTAAIDESALDMGQEPAAVRGGHTPIIKDEPDMAEQPDPGMALGSVHDSSDGAETDTTKEKDACSSEITTLTTPAESTTHKFNLPDKVAHEGTSGHQGSGSPHLADAETVKELRMLLDERERQLERLGQQAAEMAKQVSIRTLLSVPPLHPPIPL